jgi:lysophospholipase L1-like esterase
VRQHAPIERPDFNLAILGIGRSNRGVMHRKKWTFSLGVALVVFFNLEARASHSDPIFIAAAGDSITAAFIANSQAHPREINQDSWNLGQRGDHKTTLSWATGLKIDSLAVRIYQTVASDISRQLKTFNAAKSGADSSDLGRQANAILKYWESQSRPKLHTLILMIGSNNVCDRSFGRERPPTDLSNDIKLFFEALSPILNHSHDHAPRVVVNGLPRIPDLGKAEIKAHLSVRGATCQQLHQRLDLCSNLVQWKTESEYAQALGEVSTANAVIKNTLSQIQVQHPHLRMGFHEEMSQAPIHPENLAADCFHPNAKGQAIIASQVWDFLSTY